MHPFSIRKVQLQTALSKWATGLILATLLFSACSPTSKLQRSLKKEIPNSAVFKNSFTGFVLFDPESGKTVFEQNADKNFTPASNTKLFTLYTCLNMLGDSLPAVRYVETPNRITFWGTGDPTFLHPDLPRNDVVLELLRKTDKRIYFSSANFEDDRFGPGWAWDDYAYAFQVEKSPFPIHGNVVRFEQAKESLNIKITPDYFRRFTTTKPDVGAAGVFRVEDENRFENRLMSDMKIDFEQDLPFQTSDALFVDLLINQLGRDVQLLETPMLPHDTATTLYSLPVDSVYRRLMHQSDNFIAEQLMMMCAESRYGLLNSEMAIAYARDTLLTDLPDEARWVDGSGLSRYNLFTPRSIVNLLHRLWEGVPQERLFDIFPAGGKHGTIKNNYAADPPYLFAKTGTLSNNHSLSGYLVAKSGKVYLFSFMHNNFQGSSKPWKMEMERILSAIAEQY